MTFRKASLIIAEVNDLMRFDLVSYYDKEEKKKVFHEIFGGHVTPSDVVQMDFGAVVKAVESYFGDYKRNDIVIEKKSGLPCMITYVDDSKGNTLHHVDYHVVFANGITCTLRINDIDRLIGSNDEFNSGCDNLLTEYFDTIYNNQFYADED